MGKGKRWTLIGIIILIPLVTAGWWLLSPLFIDRTVDEDFPYAAGAVLPADMTRSEVESALSTIAKMDQPPMAEAMPPEMAAGPVAVAVGSFRDADSFHKGSGTATIYRSDAGPHVLRLEDFRVTNGPDLRVLLAETADPQSREELHNGGYTHLEKLKGNVGNQNYELPADLNLDDVGSVVIYCMPFQVIFSVAPLAPAG